MADFEEKNQEELKKDQSRTEFVRERVLNRSENRRRWIYRIAALVAGGLIFGVAACLAFVSAAALPLEAAAASPEFARSEEEWARLRDNVLEYEEIEDLIHEYNTTVLNNEQQYRRDTGKTSEDIVEEYLEQAENLYQVASDAEDDMTAITSEASARQAEISAENNVDDGTSRWLEYVQIEKGLAVQAQTAMNTWYQLQHQRTSLQASRDLLAVSLAAVQSQQAQGMATYSDVLTAQQSLQEMDAQIIAMDSQIDSTRKNLIVMLGWSQDAEPEIGPMPELDLDRFAAMNPQEDLQKAYEADYTLRIDQRRFDNATNEANRQIYAQTVENDRQQIAVAVNSAYSAAQQAKNDYDEAALNLQVAETDRAAAAARYQLGLISRLEYQQAETAYVSAQADLEVKKLALLAAMETYDWTIKGVRA